MNTHPARVAPEKADTPTRSAVVRSFVGGFTEKVMSDSSDFNWNENDAIVIPRMDKTAVYVNPQGDIVIRQEDPMGDDDTVVIVPRKYVGALINALNVALNDSAETFGN